MSAIKNQPVVPERKYLGMQEFIDGGYLMEVNRQFFHPLGLALSVMRTDDGSLSLRGIMDSRDDPEGFIFSDLDDADRAKAAKIAKELEDRRPEREARLGYFIQSVNNAPAPEDPS
jgi:hypothetical protein